MRVLLVLEEVKCGGAELSFFALCRSLSNRCEVHFALYEESLRHPAIRERYQALSDTSVRVHPCKVSLNPGTFSNLHSRLRRTAARELARLIDTTRPDVVIVNLPTVERGQAVLDAAARSSSRPPVWGFLHLSQRPSVIGARLGRVRDLLVPKLIRRFDRLVTVSAAGALEISQRYGLVSPAIVQPPTETLKPLPRDADRAALRKAQGLPDVFLLGMVGRIEIHHKGHDVAVRVLRRLLLQGHRMHLIVVGDGPDRLTIEKMTHRDGLDAAVSFLGWRDDVGALIPLLDAVIMPSRYEGLPQVALQAVTARVPVVGYAVGGLAELLPSDFTAGHGDEGRLAAAVASLLRRPDSWPADEVARRASAWCEPAAAADRIMGLLSGTGAGTRLSVPAHP